MNSVLVDVALENMRKSPKLYLQVVEGTCYLITAELQLGCGFYLVQESISFTFCNKTVLLVFHVEFWPT